MTLPKYINCKTNEDDCNYLMHKECKNSCPYIFGLGIGAFVKITKDLEDKLNKEKE